MSASADSHPPVLQLRVALTTAEYARLVEFYCVGLGVEPSAEWKAGGGHGSLLDMGAGTLEIFDPAYTRFIDEAEVGKPASGPVRLALQVPDVHAATKRVVAYGGKLVHDVTSTPWGDLNSRVESPDGMQITLFQTTEPTHTPIRTMGLDTEHGEHQ